MGVDVRPADRALVAAAVSAWEISDYARALVGAAGMPQSVETRIQAARQLRVLTLELLDRTVLAEVLGGASWEEVAAALGLTPETTQSRYEETARVWARPEAATWTAPGEAGDRDVEGTAAALDAWYARHRDGVDLLDEEASDPVSRILRQNGH
ncbi:hypothetical protein [Actinacidiphila sp. bgisy160]|uniref:hypothetical protein n=1 Tax=Actinacidiphila sp. bgisy160 TaxID=3413796 RepID=UPI003D71E310